MRIQQLTLLLVACTSDGERLARALDPRTPRDEGLRLCAQLGDTDAAGLCALSVMERGAGLQGEDCLTLTQPLWADECRFRLAEKQAERGDLNGGIHTCMGTRFGRECSFHLVRAQAQASAAESAVQAAARLPSVSGSVFTPDYARLFWRERFRAAQGAGRPADAGDCAAAAQPQPCLDAWSELWSAALKALTPQRLCERLAAGQAVLTLSDEVPAFVPLPEEAQRLAQSCEANPSGLGGSPP